MKQRILALVGEAYGAGGGIARYNRDLFETLSQLGDFDVHVLPRGGGGASETPDRVREGPATFGRPAYSLRAMLTALRERPDIIFCGHLFMASLARAVASLTGARLIIQLHGIEGWQTPGTATKAAVATADLVLCVSRHTRSELLAWSAIAPERVVVLPNTVGAAFTPGDRARARARFGLAAEPVILSVGRLDRREAYKGQDRVIAAIPALNAKGVRALYLVAGDGDDRPRLEALAASTGVADQVRFLGQVADADLPELYRAADVFALPSTGEGFGIVYLEAMACGVPALGLNAGGAPDALGDGELGAVIDEGDLAEALQALLTQPRPKGLAERAQARFGRSAFAQRVACVMRRLSEETDSSRMASAT